MKEKYDLELFEKLVNRFVYSTQLIFGEDWEHSKFCLENLKSFVSENGNFLNPKVESEESEWGNRALFLNDYRELLKFMDNNKITLHNTVELYEDRKTTDFIRLARIFLNEDIDMPEISVRFQKLFNDGYVVKEEDDAFITESYKIYADENTEGFERWSLLRFIEKLKDKEKINLALQNRKVLFVILSLKKGKPIGYKFPNLLGVLNNAFYYYKNSIDIIFKAIDVYDRKKEILKLDSRKGVFQRFSQEYQDDKPTQNEELASIIKIIFPELK